MHIDDINIFINVKKWNPDTMKIYNQDIGMEFNN